MGSSTKQRRARQRADRERREREQALLARENRRRRMRVVLVPAAVALATLLVVVGVVALTSGGPDQASPEQDSGVLAAEAARTRQSNAVTAAMAAGEVVAEDFTVAPGTPASSGEAPLADDRPVACGAPAPVNANSSRPRFPGGPAQVLEPGVDYVARIETSCGPIVIDLLEADAPVAVNSFVFLAQQGFYDGLEVFRDFGGIAAAQAGSGDNSVDWDIGYRLPDELELPEREGYPIGTVTTAGEGSYTAGSEFYIAYGKEFDSGFRTDRTQSTFGRVLSGMPVIDMMTAMERLGMGGEQFAERLFMDSVTIEQR